uniref:Zinc finger, SWIM-type containing 2 n=1 Tax=Erpetoichthys calabaricus TaxID=27687 RepID=A0A8C4TMK2_ERPCA
MVCQKGRYIRGGTAYTWRRSPSDAASWHQDEALRATIFLLRELGPTRFVLQEQTPGRVSLGDPHTCSCSVFQRERDLCKHVCWVLLKKFQLPRGHDYAFQLGLVEREISQLLLGAHRARTPRVTPESSEQKPGGDGLLQKKKIDPEDVCPVCQEVLLQKRLPVSYCRYGCGNSVHITCMKVWAEHQATADRDAMVKCPLCREDFAPLKLLLEEVRNSSKLMSRAEKERQDRHLGIVCQGCQGCPVVGKCFRCTACSGYYLCEPCFQKRCHPPHSFTYRLVRTSAVLAGALTHAMPYATPHSGLLCSLCPQKRNQHVVTPEQVVQALPQMKVAASSKLLEPGWQCRLCLNAFCVGQHVRRLPCNHKFHTSCIDQWLTSTSSSCPWTVRRSAHSRRGHSQTIERRAGYSRTCLCQAEDYCWAARQAVTWGSRLCLMSTSSHPDAPQDHMRQPQVVISRSEGALPCGDLTCLTGLPTQTTS